ncbi:MAG: hypothetical protein K2L51_06770, partial [Clostridiales bacterium]|nr:hypothetical protein [Clostridiales bacterium]
METIAKDDELKKAMDEIRASVHALQERPQCVDNSEKLEELNTAVAALKTAMSENTGNAAFDPKLLKKLMRSKTESAYVDITEVIRSVYELKGMLGSSDPNQQSLVNMALKAYTDLDLLHVTVANSTDFRMKLEAVENFVASVNAQDFITSDALASYEIVLKRLLDTPLDRTVFDSLCSFATATGKITVPSAKKEAANKYISFAERAKREETDSVIEFLPEMITAINDAEGAKNVSVLSDLYDDIVKVQEERKTLSTETDKREAEAEIKSLIAELCDVRVGDVIAYAPMMPLPTSDALNFTEGDSVSDRLDTLMQTVFALRETVDGLAAGGVAQSAGEESVAATVQPEVAYSVDAAENMGESLRSLQSALAALEAKVNLDDVVAEMQRNFTGVANRLANIENRLTTEVTETVAEPVAEAYTEEADPVATANAFVTEDISARLDTITEKIEIMGQGEDTVAVLDDLAFIKDKLTEEEALLGQIEALRADVAAIAENAGGTVQFDKLYEDVVAQFDKLYDDLAAVDGETAEKMNGTLAEIKEAVDGIVASDLSSAVLDGIIDFRTSYEESAASSAADRKKLLDDVAYLREQAEKRENDDVSDQTTALQVEIAENVKALEEKITALAENETAAKDEQLQSAQNVSLRIEEISAALEELKDKSVALEEGIQANGLLATENQATVSEDLTRILEQLTPAADSDQTANMYDEIVSISGRLDEIRTAYEQSNGDTMAALAEIKEQVHLKELEQNLAAVSASEEEKQTLLTEISSLRERLSTLENEQKTQADAAATQLGLIIDQITALGDTLQADEASEIVKMQDDITFIRNQIEVNMDGAAEEDPLAESLENEGLSLIMDDIAAIKEKLATLDEYDTVAEILSLREDVKNTHLLDANDLAAELEGLKGDLLDLKADIADIKTIREEADSVAVAGEGAPTSDEVNMLLGEIVSLRDEIQAYKDDVADIVTTARNEDDIPVTAVADENIAVILDELTGLHNELDGLKEESLAEQAGEIEEIKSALAEIKDMISRRTTIADDNAARDSAVSNELNVVLDEIINVKDEVAALKTDFATATETVAAQSESDAQAEKAAFADEMQTFKNELYAMVSEKLEELSVMGPEVSEELQSVKQQLSDLQMLTVGGVVTDDEQARNALAAELIEIKNMLAQSAQPAVSVEDLYNEVLALRSDLAAANGAVAPESGTVTVDFGDINKQLAEIREQLGATPAASEEPNEAVLGEILGLREELAEIREQLGNASAPAEREPDEVVLGEMLSLREELAAIRQQLGNAPVQAESEQDNAVLGEILGLREEIERLRENSVAN